MPTIHKGDNHATFGKYYCYVEVSLKLHHRNASGKNLSDYSCTAYARHKDDHGTQLTVDSIVAHFSVDGGPKTAGLSGGKANASDFELRIGKQGGWPSKGLWCFVDFDIPGIGKKEVGAVARRV